MSTEVVNKKNRASRLAIGFFLPPLFGGIFVYILIGDPNPETNLVILFFFISAFILVGLPSLIYSLLMDFVINPRVTSDLRVVLLSALLGTLIFIGLGTAIGLIVGMILRRQYILAPGVSQISGAAKL